MGERIEAMPCESKLRITPEKTLDEVPNPHILLIPGGDFGPFEAIVSDRQLKFVKRAIALYLL